MNKDLLIRAISADLGIPACEAEAVVNSALKIVGLSLSVGEAVNLRGFGSFEAHTRTSTRRLVPGVGMVEVPAKRFVAFRTSDPLMKRLNGQTDERAPDRR